MTGNKRIQELRENLRGRLFLPEDEGYDDARKVFNGLIDKRPALIVRCAGVADVITAVNFARETDLPVAIRGGGHSVAGNAVNNDGLVIDLSDMKSVHVDPEKQTARAEGGATWGDFDHETQAFGLATTGGIVPSTGIAGLTLGGGIGYLNRKFGLACDNLLSADVVTADGRFLKASAGEHEDLFWGIRGGGGNFGVVTSLEYRVHPVGPVLGGELIYPLDQAKEVLRFYRDWSTTAPDEVRADATLLSGPHGPALAIMICYCGAIEEGEKVLQPLRSFGTPMADTIAPVPYATVQNLLTEVFRPGLLHYWKAGLFRSFSDEAIDAIVDFFAGAVPAPFAAVAIEQLGGAISRVGVQDTAFSHRHAQHSLLVLRMWQNPAETEANIDWGRRCYRAAAPFLEEGVYVNYVGEEGEARARAAYGVNYERLVQLKNKYDPTNFFRLNQNIKPAPESTTPVDQT
ncbi:FAD-binding oxidoreductase [Pontibacter anaerobius]|uniref:FAD-binding oxidoreductase n=1 Tax=Pontibacter anaerobius TaxID=2993940 RepID=A0ABT3RK84_9BACT|nr:FAD-binding oxidoreductase [Pontibacter anaerobius]MCX2741712.1 FAD-binding oxidoreductase [Pontibacter anaerobius]